MNGYIGPFADAFVLGILWWVVRQVGDMKATLAAQPTNTQLSEVTRKIEELKDGIGARINKAIDQASTVVADAQDRMMTELGNESRRRHQLRDEYEDNKQIVSERLTKHGEAIAALTAPRSRR